VRSDQCQLDRVHSHGPQASPSPVSVAQNAVVLGSPGVKRHRRQTRRQHREVLGVELPRGVLENAGWFGVFGKKALQVCETTRA
jgi:hypothetical protein